MLVNTVIYTLAVSVITTQYHVSIIRCSVNDVFAQPNYFQFLTRRGYLLDLNGNMNPRASAMRNVLCNGREPRGGVRCIVVSEPFFLCA